MSTWQVVDGTQVHHDGVTYGPGETFEASDGAVDLYARAGWVTKVEGQAKAAPKRRGS